MSADSTVQHSSPATGGGGNTNINTTTTGISSTNTTLRDVILWRNPKVSSLVLIAATVTWVLFNVYKLSFVTVASWFTMLLVTSFFLYAHFVRFFRKEEPDLSGLRILVEKKAVEVEKSIREWSVAGMQCWLSASTNGVVMMLTVPVMYKRNEDRVLEAGAKVQLMIIQGAYKVDEKVLRRLKGKVVAVAAVDGDAKKDQKNELKEDDQFKTE
ncbi:Reticulon-like protein B4 [Linum grandiflorum]